MKKFIHYLLLFILLTTQQINLAGDFFGLDSELANKTMASQITSEIDSFHEILANTDSIVNPNSSNYRNSGKITSLTPTSKPILESPSTNIGAITSNQTPNSPNAEQNDALYHSPVRATNLQPNSSLISKAIQNQLREIVQPQVLHEEFDADLPDIEFIESPKTIIVEYTGEDIIIPLEWGCCK